MATGEDMKRIRTSTPTIRRKRRWPQDLPADPRDPDVVRAKALARARLIADQGQGKTAAIAVDNRGGAP
jgi:hypothetical protein